MKKMTKVNYTPEDTARLIEVYQSNPCMESVEFLAKELQRTKKSIIGKLSKEGVYRRQVYKTKTGDDPVTKVTLVAEIAAGLEIDPNTLEGLEKAPKIVLKRLLDAIL